MATRKILTIANFKNKSLISSEKVLTPTDFAIPEGNRIIISIAVSATLTLEYTRDGTNYTSVNSDVAQAANGAYIYRLQVSAGDSFNVRIKETTATLLISFLAELYLEA